SVIERALDGKVFQRLCHRLNLWPEIRIENSPGDLKLRGLLQFARQQRQSLHKNILALARLDTRQKKKAQRTRPGAVIFFPPPSQIGNGIAYATRLAVTERPIDRRGPFRWSDEHVCQRQGGAESRVFANEMLAHGARLMNPP